MDSIFFDWLERGAFMTLSFFIGLLWTKLKAEKERQNNIVEGIRALLRGRIRDIHERAMGRNPKYVTYDELQDAEDIYSAYHKLRGNGRGTALIEDLQRLKVRGGTNTWKE